MENPAIEGRQVPLNSATKKQLREFAEHLGISTTNFNTPEQLVQKFKDAGWDQNHIIVADAASKPSAQPNGGSAARLVVTEPMVSLTIHQQEGPGGKRAVFVGVNGRAILIPRNKPSEVKLRYLRALENAIETKYEYDEDAKANLPRDMPSYPYQVHRMPSEEEQARWYAFEAAEDARLRRNEPRLVATMDAAAAR